MKVGIIGCGAIAPKHALAYLGIRGIEFITIYDLITSHTLSLNYEIAQWTPRVSMVNSLEKMLIRDIDLVSLCTPPSTHAEIAIACAEANVNVLCEKPISLSLEDGRNMIRAFEVSDATLSVIFQHRWNEDVNRLRMEAYKNWWPIKASMTVNWYRPTSYYEDWKGDINRGGDIVMNQMIHHLDVMRYIFGEVKSVFAYTQNTRPEAITGNDVFVAVLKFDGGFIATIDATTVCYPKNDITELRVVTDEGVKVISPYGTPHDYQIAEVVKNVQNGVQPNVRGEDALGSLRLVHAVHQSAITGREISL